ncbi:undecaprenyl-diphosphate phosphatase [Clostridium estertheticum]|uniref:undecaprenyl-diphosphate phosphatase n=1 Tax=Clostridium estertheticum TaxID=238834 RepID=UPI001C7D2007|nr:undecaprenyl-diphosphate phosphatase [Clostridium estertheticum]MBX4261165.1 undecaprenyl-diphosphate phosphatase [Clostridium estertheticum]WLC71902.1 undecaprenyl-diphosphate phosphatase [Clostridium estertheticum]
MILILQSIIMGIVEGITEFLPISSTGHMIIVGHFINFTGAFATLFEIVIQLGAILAIVVLYRAKLWDSLKNLKPGQSGFKLLINVIVAFMPSAVLGLILHKKIEAVLFGPVPVLAALIVGGILMILVENKYRKRDVIGSVDSIVLPQAILIGCFQCLALWPGMSRSASTIMGAWIVGLNSVAAAEFSFFLAIPTMIGATALTLFKAKIALTLIEVISLIIGFLVSFIVAIVVVNKFITFLKNNRMRVFAVYRICLGVFLLVLVFMNVLK